MERHKIKKILEFINGFFKPILLIFITVMALLVITNVFLRYIFSYSLTFSAELATYLMVGIAFFGAAILVNRDEHLSINIIELYLNATLKKILKTLHILGAMVLFVVQTYYGFILVQSTSGQVVASMQFLPMNLIYLVLPLSGIIMVIGLVLRLLLLYGVDKET